MVPDAFLQGLAIALRWPSFSSTEQSIRILQTFRDMPVEMEEVVKEISAL